MSERSPSAAKERDTTCPDSTWADVRLWLDRFFAEYARDVRAIVERSRGR